MSNKNIEFYNINSLEFIESTVNADMSEWRDKFESYVAQGGRILDAGCGSGRDSKFFIQHGFSVVAFDASSEMCKYASKYLNQEVWQMKFEEICFDEEFDGIWACASLLHVSYENMNEVLHKLYKSLDYNGYLYASFKYGNEVSSKGDRTFTNYTLDSIKACMEEVGFNIIELGITTDVRPGRDDEKWVNVIVKKN